MSFQGFLLVNLGTKSGYFPEKFSSRLSYLTPIITVFNYCNCQLGTSVHYWTLNVIVNCYFEIYLVVMYKYSLFSYYNDFGHDISVIKFRINPLALRRFTIYRLRLSRCTLVLNDSSFSAFYPSLLRIKCLHEVKLLQI